MQAIRSITQVDADSITIDISDNFRGQSLEIIILPFQVEKPKEEEKLAGLLEKICQ